MTPATDFEICSLLKTRKMEGMELLFNKYYKPLVVWADTFLRDIQRAEDVVQDFFTRLWERERLDKADPLAGACDVAEHEEPWEEYDDFEDEVFRRVEEEVGKLPPRSQAIIRGVYLRGMRYREVAEELGVSVATVNSLLVSALKKLRQTLGDDPAKLISWFYLKKLFNESDRYGNSGEHRRPIA